MEFTAQKKHTVTASYLLAACVFGGGTIYLLLKHAPHGKLYWFQLSGLLGMTILLLGVVTYWMVFPHRHPVDRALAVHGDAAALAERLNAEMVCVPEVQGPFSFGSSFLTYSPGYEFDFVPYDSISSAMKELADSGEGGTTPVIVVQTNQGKTYKWYRTLMQGMFDPDQVLLSIRRRAGLTRKIGEAYYRSAETDSNEQAR